jgi:serine/threonine-protein kinase HipA
MLELTPAYDLCPQGRSGFEATQAMLISEQNRASQISACLQAAHLFLLSKNEAIALVEAQIQTIGEQWQAVCEAAELNETDKNLLWGRQFFNPYAFFGLDDEAKYLSDMAEAIRNRS